MQSIQMKIGDFDIELSAETSLEMLIVLAYYCAYDGSEAEAAQVRSLLEAQLEQCNDDTLKSQAHLALSMLSRQPVEIADFSDFVNYTEKGQIAQLAKLAYTSETFGKCANYDEIKKIYNLINLRIFNHEPESVHPDGDEVNFEVDYGNLTVDLSDMDLLDLILVDRYLFMNVPLGLGPDNSLNLTAELVRRSNDGDAIATAILAWFDLYFYREH
jgi:hypothetical protein